MTVRFVVLHLYFDRTPAFIAFRVESTLKEAANSVIILVHNFALYAPGFEQTIAKFCSVNKWSFIIE